MPEHSPKDTAYSPSAHRRRRFAAREVFAEIGEVVAGVRPGRETADEITRFKSVGVAVEDVAAADLVYRHNPA